MISHTYYISGMTCEGCVKSVKEKLLSVPHLKQANVSLEMHQAQITSSQPLFIEDLQLALGSKYQINAAHLSQDSLAPAPSKLKQLKPLLLIFTYLIGASVLIEVMRDGYWQIGMLNFMGLFFVVFSFFKFLDLKGFVTSFSMYDPLAKAVKPYGWIYPFIELLLGVVLLIKESWVGIALIVTIVVLGITTVGVLRVLLNKKSIQCACLGTALKLPMTEATLIENVLMIVMAAIMIVNIYL